MGMTLFAALILFSIAMGLWIFTHLQRKPSFKRANARARITGTCGDTMEILLEFKNGRVNRTALKTNGCAHSLTCLLMAAKLSKGRYPEEILDIDAKRIFRAVGGLPQDHRHCAALAARTLHNAVDNYMRCDCQTITTIKKES